MICNITFQVVWYELPGENRVRLEITPGNVENMVGEGIPLSMYLDILQALLQVEKQINGCSEQQTIKQPPALKEDKAPLPPPPKKVVQSEGKKPKRYTVEEKTDIAMLYASGQDIATIAKKYGREPQAIRILVNKMGVKRGDDITDPGMDEPKEPGSALKKPWYLK